MNFKKGFTVVEMVIVIIILSVGLIGVIATLSDSYSFMYNVKTKLTAINLARGGMEGIFTIRNSNWQRWGGKKDKCWLKIDPLVDNNNDGCENDEWFGTGSYIISITGDSQKYFYLTGINNRLITGGDLVDTDWKYLVYKGNDGYLVAGYDKTERPNNYFDSSLYFRQIRGGYLLDKKSGTDLSGCANGEDNKGGKDCGSTIFKEKNFCVDVMYFNGSKKSVTFCSVLTNFKE